MAWHQLTFSCGHSKWDRVGGVKSHVDRVHASAAGRPCPSCRALRAALESADQGLPQLRGSEAQVAWAHALRAEALEASGPYADELAKREAALEDPRKRPGHWTEADVAAAARALSEARAALAHIMRQQDAGWWIDRRGQGIKLLVHRVRTEEFVTSSPPPNTPSQRNTPDHSVTVR